MYFSFLDIACHFSQTIKQLVGRHVALTGTPYPYSESTSVFGLLLNIACVGKEQQIPIS
jgi:hypothetical protein